MIATAMVLVMQKSRAKERKLSTHRASAMSANRADVAFGNASAAELIETDVAPAIRAEM